MDIEELKEVIDDEDQVYTVGKMIGQGGQGAVYRLSQSNLAIKVLTNGNKIVDDSDNYNRYKDFISDVIVMKLDNDINLCRPIRMLKRPTCGYIMHLLDGLEPISNLFIDTNSDEDINSLFRRTFGLKKRYEVLTELARMMARLHSKGIIYSDLSPNNVFYSNIEELSKVWLIDCDNLRFTDAERKPIFTPAYGAPEVICGVTSNTIFSDCYSFAVLAFKLLTNNHPFESKLINSDNSSGEDDWDKSADENESINVVYKKWIYDNANDENKEYFNHFIVKDLLELFIRTFSKDGYLCPTMRPSMTEWYEVLKQATLKISKCEQCGQYIFTAEDKCQFCSAENKKSNVLRISYLLQNYSEDAKKYLDSQEFEINDELKAKIQKNNVIRIKDIHLYDGLIINDFEFDFNTVDRVPKEILKFEKISGGFNLINYSSELIFVKESRGVKSVIPNSKIYISESNTQLVYKNSNTGITYVLGVYLDV